MVPWPNVLSSLFQRKQTPQAINLHLLFPRLCSPESMSKYKICLLNMMRPSPPPDIFAVSCEVMWGTSWVCRRGGVCVCVWNSQSFNPPYDSPSVCARWPDPGFGSGLLTRRCYSLLLFVLARAGWHLGAQVTRPTCNIYEQTLVYFK